MLQAFDRNYNQISHAIYEDDFVLDVYPVLVNSSEYQGEALIIEFDSNWIQPDCVKVLSPTKQIYSVNINDCVDL